jgi:hypothetical protein
LDSARKIRKTRKEKKNGIFPNPLENRNKLNKKINKKEKINIGSFILQPL